MHNIKEIRELSRRIGGNLHARRCTQRMSLRTLARLTGLPEWRLDEIELGKGELRLDELFRLSKALRCASLADMLDSHSSKAPL